MLTITIPAVESFDEATNEFVNSEETILHLEHSLVSLSKWESKWETPFLGDSKTDEQTIDYVKCMTFTKDVDPNVYNRLSSENVKQVSTYIDAKMTATWFADKPAALNNKEAITAEIVYYWMISLSIPFECQEWHLNRLLTLIKVCNQKNAPAAKKMTRSELATRNRELNESRKLKMKTEG